MPKGTKSIVVSGASPQSDPMGSDTWAAPEQTRAVDIRSDIYSLGITIYQLLSGSIPKTRMGVPPLAEITTIRSDISPVLPQVIDKMIMYHEEDRFQSIAEIQAKMSFNGKCRLSHLEKVEANDIEVFINPDIVSANDAFVKIILPTYHKLINYLQNGLFDESFSTVGEIEKFLEESLSKPDPNVEIFVKGNKDAEKKRIYEHLKMLSHCKIHLAFDHLAKIPEAKKAAKILSKNEIAEVNDRLLQAEIYEQVGELKLAKSVYTVITQHYPTELLAFQKLKEVEDKIEAKKPAKIVKNKMKCWIPKIKTGTRTILLPLWNIVTDKKQWDIKSILNLLTNILDFSIMMGSIIFFVTISMTINAYRFHILDIGFGTFFLVTLAFLLIWLGNNVFIKTKDGFWFIFSIIGTIILFLGFSMLSSTITTNCQWGERALVHIAGKVKETPFPSISATPTPTASPSVLPTNTPMSNMKIEVNVPTYHEESKEDYNQRWERMKKGKIQTWKMEFPGTAVPEFVPKAVHQETPSPSATSLSSPSVSPITPSPLATPTKTTKLIIIPKKQPKPVETPKPTPSETPSETPESQVPPYIR